MFWDAACCFDGYVMHASQEQTLGGKKRPSVVNPLGMLYTVLGTIKVKNKKNWLGNIAFVA